VAGAARLLRLLGGDGPPNELPWHAIDAASAVERPAADPQRGLTGEDLVVPDGVFVSGDEGLRFETRPVPINANVLAIVDRIMRQIARRLAKDATNREHDEVATPDVFAQVLTKRVEHPCTW